MTRGRRMEVKLRCQMSSWVQVREHVDVFVVFTITNSEITNSVMLTLRSQTLSCWHWDHKLCLVDIEITNSVMLTRDHVTLSCWHWDHKLCHGDMRSCNPVMLHSDIITLSRQQCDHKLCYFDSVRSQTLSCWHWFINPVTLTRWDHKPCRVDTEIISPVLLIVWDHKLYHVDTEIINPVLLIVWDHKLYHVDTERSETLSGWILLSRTDGDVDWIFLPCFQNKASRCWKRKQKCSLKSTLSLR